MGLYEEAVKLWKSWDIKTENDLDQRLENFRILFAYNSGKIENDEITYHNTREIFENGKVVNFTGNPRSIFEIENQKLCYEYLKSKIVSKEKISKELVLETHYILTSGTYDEKRYIEKGERPGKYKKNDYVTGRNEVGSLPEDVPGDIDELLEEVNSFEDGDIMMAAAYFHARFENIHPFSDGNGRTGRTLMNYFLTINEHPPAIIYEENKDRYYKCLEKYDEKEDLTEMREFLKEQISKTWEKTIERNKEKGKKGIRYVSEINKNKK